MECLENVISVRGCNVDESESGLYVNDLAGISLKSMDNSANEEQKTFYGLWKQCEKRAINKLKTLTTLMLSKKFKLKRVVEYYKGWSDNLNTSNTTALSTDKSGFIVSLSNELYQSELSVINLQELKFYSLSDQDLEFNIYNFETKELIQTLTKSCLTGWNRIAVGRKYLGIDTIFVSVSGTELAELKLDIKTDCIDCGCIDLCGATIKGVTCSDDFYDIEYLNNSFGLTAVININCSYESFICNNTNLFTNVLWLLSGVEVLTERINSDRINRFTTIDAKKAFDLKEEYAKEAMQELVDICDSININKDCCLDCNAQITLQTNLP